MIPLVILKILRKYPFTRGKAFLSNLFLSNCNGIPNGAIVPTRDGLNIYVHPDPIYRSVFLFGEYEPANTAMFKELIRPGDILLDVGANFGWYTTLFAKLTGKSGRVLAIEPLPDVAFENFRNIQLNNFTDTVKIINAALGSCNGDSAIFTFSHLSHAHSSMSTLGRGDGARTSCKMMTLDDCCVLEQLPCIHLIKIDVEGYELNVLQGAARTLTTSYAPIVLFEINIDCLQNQNTSAVALRQCLESYGYKWFWAVKPFGGLILMSAGMPNFNCDCIALKESHYDRIKNGPMDSVFLAS